LELALYFVVLHVESPSISRRNDRITISVSVGDIPHQRQFLFSAFHSGLVGLGFTGLV
jgi:hypothetical protein